MTEPPNPRPQPADKEMESATLLAQARAGAKNLIGKFWSAPNTAIGLAYGLAGQGVGTIIGTHPRIRLHNNAVQFANNPLGGVGAITLGNTTTWKGDPYDPSDRVWHEADGQPSLENGHTYPEHEEQHTRQGEQLGPFYLPSNLLGGLNGLRRGEGWHGKENWNETGPQMNPPRPWGGRAK